MRILCLANSYKEGGRCIAGILLDENNAPVFNNGRPVWIRPICKAKHGQVPNYLCKHIVPLDIIQIDGTKVVGTGYQSENTTFDENQILVVDKVEKTFIDNLHDTTSLIFKNRGKALPEDIINELDHSLLLVRSNEFEIIEKKYEDKEHPQIRLNFVFNGNSYNLPITDPIFLNKYEDEKSILDQNESIDIILSLGVPFREWYYKLVATIIY